jgi:very-short-patch-repair endonuclease
MQKHLPRYTKSLIPAARRLRRDKLRDADLRRDGLEVLRFTNADVLMNSEGVEQVISEKVEATLKQVSK